ISEVLLRARDFNRVLGATASRLQTACKSPQRLDTEEEAYLGAGTLPVLVPHVAMRRVGERPRSEIKGSLPGTMHALTVLGQQMQKLQEAARMDKVHRALHSRGAFSSSGFHMEVPKQRPAGARALDVERRGSLRPRTTDGFLLVLSLWTRTAVGPQPDGRGAEKGVPSALRAMRTILAAFVLAASNRHPADQTGEGKACATAMRNFHSPALAERLLATFAEAALAGVDRNLTAKLEIHGSGGAEETSSSAMSSPDAMLAPPIFVPRSVEPAQCGVRRRCDARQHRHTSTFPDLDNQESEMGSRACQRTILVEQCRFQKRADLASRAALDAGRALMLTLLRFLDLPTSQPGHP
ncbi:unnamed protein product, partial [Symbiodinium microadriaticum]